MSAKEKEADCVVAENRAREKIAELLEWLARDIRASASLGYWDRAERPARVLAMLLGEAPEDSNARADR